MKDAKFWIERGMVPPAAGYTDATPRERGLGCVHGLLNALAIEVAVALAALIGWGLWRVL